MSQAVVISFDYTALPGETAEFLRESAAYINTRLSLTYQMIAEVGQRLIDCRDRIPEGRFAQWCQYELGVNEDTVFNYMNVARLPAPPPDAVKHLTLSALYRLGSPNTSPEAIQAAYDLALNQQKVDRDTAFLLAAAPAPIQARYFDSGELSKTEAVALTRIVTSPKAAPEASAAIMEWRVKDPAVAEYLVTAYAERETRTAWAVISEDNSLNGDGWSVPLENATAHDLARFKDDRRRMHLEEAGRKAQPETGGWRSFGLRSGTITRRGRELIITLSAGCDIPDGLTDARVEGGLSISLNDLKEFHRAK